MQRIDQNTITVLQRLNIMEMQIMATVQQLNDTIARVETSLQTFGDRITNAIATEAQEHAAALEALRQKLEEEGVDLTPEIDRLSQFETRITTLGENLGQQIQNVVSQAAPAPTPAPTPTPEPTPIDPFPV